MLKLQREVSMSYVENNLIQGEQVVYRAELHWKIFIWPAIFSLILIGIPWLIAVILQKKTTEMAVTNKRVIIKTGILSRRTIEMNLSKIENIEVNQNIIGRIFGYGIITIVGTGGTHEPFENVSQPLEFRKSVLAQGQ
jgi:uncharacterized membrane protein YdbT with pleckstrin-like domain